ncbi:Hypothetical protein NocV09_00401790 [Nannochloropsis oceanica]
MSNRRRPRPVQDGDNEDAGDEDEGNQPDLLDEDEQARLIAELRRKGEEQSQSTRRLFQALYVLLLLAFIYCTAMTLTMPYFLEHQAFFQSAVSPFSFLLTYFADVQCVVAAISVFAGRPNKTLLFLGFGVGVLNLVAWLGVFYQYTPYPAIGFWWLPVTALFVLAVSLHVDRDLRRLTKEIDLLDKLKYDYKKV